MRTSKGFHEASGPMLRSCRLWGLCKYRFVKRNNRIALIKDAAWCYIATLPIFVYSIYAVLFDGVGIGSLNNIIYLFMKLGNILVIFGYYIKTHVGFDKILQVIKGFQMVDDKLQAINANRIELKSFNIIVRTNLLLIYLLSTVIVVSYGLVFVKIGFLEAIYNLPTIFFAYIASGHINLLLLCIKFESTRRYRMINGLIEVSSLESLKKIKIIYKGIYDLNQCANEFAQNLILIKFMLCFIYLLAGTQSYTDDYEHVVYFLTTIWITATVTDVIWIIYAIDHPYQESKKTALLYENALKTHDVHFTKRGLFYLQVQFEKNVFSVCGLFTINWNFLLAMFGSVVTNLVILLQFKKLSTS